MGTGPKTSSAGSGTRKTKKASVNGSGAPPALPRKDALPPAAKAYSRAGRGVSNSTSRAGVKGRPNSAPNTVKQSRSSNGVSESKAGRKDLSSATASSSAKRRANQNLHPSEADTDDGRAALQELLK